MSAIDEPASEQVLEGLQILQPEALPRVPGLRFSAKYLPAGSGLKLGGDWYDIFTLPDGCLAFVIGDVVGRGIVAASVMAEIRAALRAYAIERHDLVTVMSLLNELMLTMGRNRSATVAMLALDLETEELSAISAGHVPTLVRYADGHHEFIAEASGPPLGTHMTRPYSVQSLRFPAESALLLFTDGLVERRGEPIDRGLERLTDALHSATDADRLPLADGVFQSMTIDMPLEDDMTLLAIESLGRERES